MESHAPDDPEERHDFDSLMECIKATHLCATQSNLQEHILVFVIHGIRDEGPWMEMIKQVLQSENITVQPTDFDDVGAVRFMLGCKTNDIIKATRIKLLDAIDNAERKHAALRIMAIGHSFGTYILLKVLEDNPTLIIEKMIFCGSVAPRDFRYDQLKNRPMLLVNDCGARDIWPIVAEGFGRLKYGAAGVRGLRVTNVEDRYHDFGHSGYLEKSFVEQFWKPFITEGKVVSSEYSANRRPIPRGVALLGYGYKLIGLLALVWFYSWFWQLVLKDRSNYPYVVEFCLYCIEFLTFFLPGIIGSWILFDTVRYLYPKLQGWLYFLSLLALLPPVAVSAVIYWYCFAS
jgi:hypothetical protein